MSLNFGQAYEASCIIVCNFLKILPQKCTFIYTVEEYYREKNKRLNGRSFANTSGIVEVLMELMDFGLM